MIAEVLQLFGGVGCFLWLRGHSQQVREQELRRRVDEVRSQVRESEDMLSLEQRRRAEADRREHVIRHNYSVLEKRLTEAREQAWLPTVYVMLCGPRVPNTGPNLNVEASAFSKDGEPSGARFAPERPEEAPAGRAQASVLDEMLSAASLSLIISVCSAEPKARRDAMEAEMERLRRQLDHYQVELRRERSATREVQQRLVQLEADAIRMCEELRGLADDDDDVQGGELRALICNSSAQSRALAGKLKSSLRSGGSPVKRAKSQVRLRFHDANA